MPLFQDLRIASMGCIEGLSALSHRADYLSKKNGISGDIKFHIGCPCLSQLYRYILNRINNREHCKLESFS